MSDNRKVCTTCTILTLGSFWNKLMNDNPDRKIRFIARNLDEQKNAQSRAMANPKCSKWNRGANP
jgi:hypothetical protein